MANVGRETILYRDAEVVAGVRVLGIDWKSESVDISQGESDGYRRTCEIDGLATIDISVEGITKDNYFQEIAYKRDQSRLLTDITMELPNPDGGAKSTIRSDFYLANLNITGEYNGAISFSCSLIGSSIIDNGAIIGISRDSETGKLSGTIGYTYSKVINININTRNFDIEQSGFCYINGIDGNGVQADVDGTVIFNENPFTVDRVQYSSGGNDYTVISSLPTPVGRQGVIVFDTAKSNPFITFFGFGDVVWAWYNSDSQQWFFDGNQGGFSTFNPSPTMSVIGLINTGASVVNSATIFTEARPLSDYEI